MKKQDIKDNGYYFRLIIIYAIILGVVYSVWMYKVGLPIWSYILVGALFVVGGVGLAFLYVQRQVSKKAKQEAQDVNANENAIAEIEQTETTQEVESTENK